VTTTSPAPTSADLAAAATEVDTSLLAMYREMSVVERLRAASRAAASLDRWRRAASTDR
jgi:hypothetical protein